MKKSTLALGAILFSGLVFSQVGINTETPTATMDIKAKNPTGTTTGTDGILVPRVDRQRAQSMTSVPTSTLIYVNDISTGTATGNAARMDRVGYYYYDGTIWFPLDPDLRNVGDGNHITNDAGVGGNGSSGGSAGGSSNIFIGRDVGKTNTSGNNNIVLATDYFASNTIGSANVSIGGMFENTTGSFNTALGDTALYTNSSGNENVAVGAAALYDNVSGTNNTAVGYSAGYVSGNGGQPNSENSYFGNYAAISFSTGTGNTFLGARSGAEFNSGNNNIAIGYLSGYNSGSSATGSNNIFIGSNTGFNIGVTASNQMNIGNLIFGKDLNGNVNAPAGNIGIGAKNPATKLHILQSTANSDAMLIQSADFGAFKGLVIQDTGGANTSRFVITPGYIANNDPTTALNGVPASNANGLNSVTFDVEGSNFDIYTFQEGIIRPGYNNQTDLGAPNHRFKNLYLVNAPNVSSDIRIKKDIKTLSYGLKEIKLINPISYVLKEDKKEEIKLGFSAQELQTVLPEIVESAPESGILGVSYTELIPVLVNAVKEQQKEIDALKARLKAWEERK